MICTGTVSTIKILVAEASQPQTRAIHTLYTNYTCDRSATVKGKTCTGCLLPLKVDFDDGKLCP